MKIFFFLPRFSNPVWFLHFSHHSNSSYLLKKKKKKRKRTIVAFVAKKNFLNPENSPENKFYFSSKENIYVFK